jgi:hypothetical protein
LGLVLDGVDRAFGLADPAIYAFFRVNNEEVFALIEAVDRTDFDTVHQFATHACICDDVGHTSGP